MAIRFLRPNFRVCILLFLALNPSAWSQTTLGVVSGTVRDQTGGVIPKAVLALTNTDTNVTENATSNEVGFYIFSSVAAGPYRLTGQSVGMQKFDGSFVI